MDAEKIAREIVGAIHIDVGGWDYWGERPFHDNPNEIRGLIATALAAARRAGFDACKEQAAGIADRLAAEYDTDEPGDLWDDGANCAANEISAAIRALEPKT